MPQLSYLLLRGGLFGIGQVSVALLDFTFCSFLIVASCFHRSGYVFFRNPLVILDRPTIPFDQIVRLGIRRRNCVFAYLKPRWICCDICTGPVLFAQGVTGLATCSQGYLSYKLTGPVLLAQGITGLAALSHSQSYLSCKLTTWSCCSRNYWSCSFSSLTGLPILQTHGLTVWSARRQDPRKHVLGSVTCYTSQISITGVLADSSFADSGLQCWFSPMIPIASRGSSYSSVIS